MLTITTPRADEGEKRTKFLQEIIVNSTKRTKKIHDKREQRIVVVDLRESGTQN
jgi:hypothetical protein